MYELEIKPEVDKIFRKLAKRDIHQLRIIHKKIKQMQENPERDYKFLRSPLQNYTSVHIDSHFILIFKIDHDRKTVVIYYYAHHDYAYGWHPQKA